MAARAAAHERAIVFGPILPVIPKPGVQADEPLAVLHVPRDRGFRRIVGPRFVVADDQDIHTGDDLRQTAGGFGVIGAYATGVIERFHIGDVEPTIVVVAGAAADDQHFQTCTPWE